MIGTDEVVEIPHKTNLLFDIYRYSCFFQSVAVR